MDKIKFVKTHCLKTSNYSMKSRLRNYSALNKLLQINILLHTHITKHRFSQSAFYDHTVTDGNHFTTHYKGKLSPGTPVLVVVFSSLASVCTAHRTAHYQSSSPSTNTGLYMSGFKSNSSFFVVVVCS